MNKDNLAKRFLLGNLTEEEQTAIEKEFFHDRNFFENILIIENELIDEYAKGNLSSEDKTRFENRLLLNPHQRQRVEFSKNLTKYASHLPLMPAEETRQPWLARLFSGKPLLSFSFAATALVLFAGIVWIIINLYIAPTDDLAASQTQMRDQNQPTINTNVVTDPTPEALPTSPKPAPPENRKTEEPPKTKEPAIFSFVLSPGLTRDAGSGQKFSIPAGMDFVRMELKLEENDFSSYRAILETVEGNEVWRSNRLPVKKGGQTVTVLIPAKLLKKADYILSLKGFTGNGIYEPVADFTFTIAN